MLDFVDFIQKHALCRLDTNLLERPIPDNKTPSLSVILIDNRKNLLSIASVCFAFDHLVRKRPNTFMEIWTTRDCLEFYDKYCGKIATIKHCPRLEVCKFHIDVYNDIMFDTSAQGVWKQMNVKNVQYALIIQDDGMILKNWDESFETFLKYDYVGAPWHDDVLTGCRVGNGGFSLRKVSKFLDVLQSEEADFHSKQLFFANTNSVPEDVFFSRMLGKSVAGLQEAVKFSSEQLLNSDSIGIHKPWPYHDPETMNLYWKSRLQRR
jgi:hypothetical protein